LWQKKTETASYKPSATRNTEINSLREFVIFVFTQILEGKSAMVGPEHQPNSKRGMTILFCAAYGCGRRNGSHNIAQFPQTLAVSCELSN
jgi:hypothetical protein